TIVGRECTRLDHSSLDLEQLANPPSFTSHARVNGNTGTSTASVFGRCEAFENDKTHLAPPLARLRGPLQRKSRRHDSMQGSTSVPSQRRICLEGLRIRPSLVSSQRLPVVLAVRTGLTSSLEGSVRAPPPSR